MSKRRFCWTALGLVLLAQFGCGAASWSPPPPRGPTYDYDYQGYRSSDTTVVGGTHAGMPAYGAAFAFREYRDVHAEDSVRDPFVQSAPIDGVRFNAHLQAQGAQLTPGAGR